MNMNNIEEKFNDLQTILHSSKKFSFEKESILKLREYYGNKKVYLDLSKLNVEMFEELYYDPEKKLESGEDYEL